MWREFLRSRPLSRSPAYQNLPRGTPRPTPVQSRSVQPNPPGRPSCTAWHVHNATCTEMKSDTRVWPKWNYTLSPSAHTHTAHTHTLARSHSPQYHDFVVSPRRVFSSRGISFDVVVIIIISTPGKTRCTHTTYTLTRAHTHRIMSLDSDTHRRRCRRPVGRRDLCMCVEGLCRSPNRHLFSNAYLLLLLLVGCNKNISVIYENIGYNDRTKDGFEKIGYRSHLENRLTLTCIRACVV